MTRLNQVIAVEKGVKSKTFAELSAAHQILQKPQPLSGIARSYRPVAEDGERFPDESTRVQIKVDSIINAVSDSLTHMFDITATKDWANAVAVADVVVDGKTLLSKVPVTYLLFLEKQLVDLHTFVKKLPTLDQAETWTADEASDAWATAPVETAKTKKVYRNHVKAQATPQHPEQVEIFTEDVVVGYWKTIKYSGALPASRVNELLERVNTLQEAVKFAREEANGAEVTNQYVGAKIFAYVFS